jgi:hypothetical protein
MDEKNTHTGWIVAGVLTVVVVALGGVLWNAAQTREKGLDEVLTEGYEDIAKVRAEVQIKCEGPASSDAECERALDELANILRDFGEDLNEASTTKDSMRSD